MAFLTGISVFLSRKLIFLMRKQFFHIHNLSAHSYFFAEFLQPRNRDSPFSIWGCAKLCFHMGIPVWKRGLLFFNPCMEMGIPHFHMGMCQSLFPYGDPHMEIFLAANFLALQLRLVRDSMAGQNYSPRFHMGNPHMETCRPTKKFPFGDSPLPNRVCAHMGINICTWGARGMLKSGIYKDLKCVIAHHVKNIT